MSRPTPPDLEFDAPECPLCGTETSVDAECFWCETCGATWDHNGTGGEWDDPDAKRCESRYKRYSYPDRECVLTEGHEGRHISARGFFHWSDLT